MKSRRTDVLLGEVVIGIFIKVQKKNHTTFGSPNVAWVTYTKNFNSNNYDFRLLLLTPYLQLNRVAKAT